MRNRDSVELSGKTIEEDVRELRIVAPKLEFPGNKATAT